MQGYIEDWRFIIQTKGTLGGNISPILANIYLDNLTSIGKIYSTIRKEDITKEYKQT